MAGASTQASAGQLAVGTVLNRTHRIDALHAQGGMGQVYRATNLATGDVVAIKVMRPEFFGDPAIKKLFLREGAVLRKLRHPAVVYYEGTFLGDGGQLYIAMEYVDGPTLATAALGSKLTTDDVRRLRTRLAAGLAAAHEIGLVHRDLSPDNIILPGGRLEEAKLVDFGISRLLASSQTTVIGGSFAGKLGYAAPEQFGMFNGAIDARTDIYSLGLVLAYAATGAALDMGRTPDELIAARRRVPDLARVPEDLRDELAHMLQPDPADRPGSMAALTGAARRGQGTIARLRSPGKAAAAAAVVAVLAGGAWLAARVLWPPPAPRPASVAIPPTLGTHAAESPPAAAAGQGRRRAVEEIVGAYPEPRAVFRDRHAADGSTCAECPQLIVVPAGRFIMGATAEEEQRENVPTEQRGRAQPLTAVQIRQSFAVARNPVTRGQYAAFARRSAGREMPGCSWHAPGFQQTDDEPVVCVSWEDAQAYARWLSEQTAYTYRLPSEAEWEYAARAGTTTARWWGDAIGEGNAICFDCGSRWDQRSTGPSASFPPNAFGLYDMLGNVWFWMEDCWNASLAERPRDDRAVLTGNCSRRVTRGGSWQSPAWAVRSAHRDWEGAGNRQDDVGILVLRDLGS